MDKQTQAHGIGDTDDLEEMELTPRELASMAVWTPVQP